MKKLVCPLALLALALFFSCQESPKPKPKGFIALSYPKAHYKKISSDCPYTFEINNQAKLQKPKRDSKSCSANLVYPTMKGTIFLTYQPVHGNLNKLLADAQQLPLEHTIKASTIEGDVYTNPRHQTYGTFYEVKGNAASQAQFYLTDSVSHFITGSIYFKVRPNFDSLVPAAAYIEKDMRHLMETVRWK